MSPGRSLALRNHEVSIDLQQHILDLREEMRRHDDELARIASNALIGGPGDDQDALTLLQPTFAQDVDERVGGASVGLLDLLVDLSRSHFVPDDTLLTKAHSASIWEELRLRARGEADEHATFGSLREGPDAPGRCSC